MKTAFKCVGIDGTKDGWIAACIEDGGIKVQKFKNIGALCAEYADADSMPLR